jgi:phosphohistidine phosphatase
MKPFELCFFRHGIAVEKDDPSVTSDAERPLTDEGARKTRAAAEGLSRLNGGYDKLLTSPWVRAKQTAAILAEVLELTSEELPELAGDRTPEDLVKALTHRHGRHTLLVGHEPLLSATVVHLLGGDWLLDLKKAGACSLEVDALPSRKPATLLWHMTARQLRSLGGRGK